MEVTTVRPGDYLLCKIPAGTNPARIKELVKLLTQIKEEFSLSGVITIAGDMDLEILRPFVDTEGAIVGLQGIVSDLETNDQQVQET